MANVDVATTDSATSKPTVCIVGALGYVGRFLSHHVHSNNLASTLRLVDKQLPELALLAPEFLPTFTRDRYMQADASRPANTERLLTTPDGKPFDYVFNCAGDQRFNQDDAVYKLRSHALSIALGTASAKLGVKTYVECSTGSIYDPKDHRPAKEGERQKPWLKLARWKLQAEEDLALMQSDKCSGLRLVVIRLPHVYGPYTVKWLGTALALARVYQHLGKELKFLWSRELKQNCVHVEDVAHGLWRAAQWRANQPDVVPGMGPGDTPSYPIFNMVDHSDLTQDDLAKLLSETMQVETTFTNTLTNAFARLNLEYVVDDANNESLDPWGMLTEQAGCEATNPISPYMEKDLLQDKDMALDGSKFERVTGFTYRHPTLTKDEVRAVVDSYKRRNWWP